MQSNTVTGPQFAIVPAALLDSDLPSGARAVFVALASFANRDGTSCFPSQDAIAQRSGLKDRMVRRWLDRLEDDGWIARTAVSDDAGRRVGTDYDLRPAHWKQADRDRESVSEMSTRPVAEYHHGVVTEYHPGWSRSTTNQTKGPDQEDQTNTNLPSVGSSSDVPERPDVEGILDALEDHFTAIGAATAAERVAKRARRDRDAIRRLIDRDGKTPERIHACIRWLTAGEHRDARFWQGNVLSASTLREKFERMEVQARSRAANGHGDTDRYDMQSVARGLDYVQRVRQRTGDTR